MVEPIHLDAWRRRKQGESKTPAPAPVELPPPPKSEGAEKVDTLLLYAQMMLAARELEGKLHGLGAHNPQKVRDFERIVKDYSDEAVLAWMTKQATDANLSSKPNFFHAVLHEGMRRSRNLSSKPSPQT